MALSPEQHRHVRVIYHNLAEMGGLLSPTRLLRAARDVEGQVDEALGAWLRERALLQRRPVRVLDILAAVRAWDEETHAAR